MDFFSLLDLVGFLDDFRPMQPKRPSRIEQGIYELSDDLDYYINKAVSYTNRIRYSRSYYENR